MTISAYVAPIMDTLKIITLPDPVLRKKSEAIETVNDELRSFLDQMLATMYDAPGIGLAAIQVGVPKRVVTVDVSKREDEEAEKDPLFLVNPEIVWRSDELSTYEEGCLSIPEYFAEIERPAAIEVNYVDYSGQSQSLRADGLLATCIQHEVDHLDGTLFIDYLSRLKRDLVVRKFTKAARAAENDKTRITDKAV